MDDLFIKCCGECGIRYAVPRAFDQNRRETRKTFYCPNGHPRVYNAGQSEADTLRREAERLKQRLAERDDAIAAERRARELAERQVAAQKGLVTKARKRAAAGVCQCCNRTFLNVQQHMAEKHPQFVCDDAGLNVVPMKRKKQA